MTKRLMLLVVMLAMVLGGAVPVLAQEGADQGEWTDARRSRRSR